MKLTGKSHWMYRVRNEVGQPINDVMWVDPETNKYALMKNDKEKVYTSLKIEVDIEKSLIIIYT